MLSAILLAKEPPLKGHYGRHFHTVFYTQDCLGREAVRQMMTVAIDAFLACPSCTLPGRYASHRLKYLIKVGLPSWGFLPQRRIEPNSETALLYRLQDEVIRLDAQEKAAAVQEALEAIHMLYRIPHHVLPEISNKM